MGIRIDASLTPQKLVPAIERCFEISAAKIRALEKTWSPGQGTPVFTVNGRYTTRGWTEWTQGFQFGSAILQFDATGDPAALKTGLRGTRELMASHVSHTGVHDHGFNNVSTYGNLLRLVREGRIEETPGQRDFYEVALKVSGAVQAARWTRIADGTGFIHSFNGPHSLFVDTMRSLRSLAIAHEFHHVLMGEQDERIDLLQRLVEHATNTARYNVYYGTGRDAYDLRGRTAHEAVFNTVSGVYRSPNSQQGYSPFTTWTRGLAWALLGFSEQLEFFCIRHAETFTRHKTLPATLWAARGGAPTEPGEDPVRVMLRAALATADFYMDACCSDGVPMWDTGAPNLHRLGDYQDQPSDPFNAWEPVDSSAAAIAAQGFLRLANVMDVFATRLSAPATARGSSRGKTAEGTPAALATRYRLAGLKIAQTLLEEPYLSRDRGHQGLLLHSVYHRPNGWDAILPGQRVPNGESSMWGDYHLRELALLIRRIARKEAYLTFFGCCEAP